MHRFLIFDSSITGHHLEYLHHLYSLAVNEPENHFFFLLPKDFEEVKEKLEWQQSDNIKILYLSAEEKKLCSDKNLLKSAWYKSMVVRQTVKQYSITHVWLIMLMHLMPFLPFLLPRRTKIKGILYRIYLYDNDMSIVRLCLERARYKLIVHSKNIEKIFVLNDKWAAQQLNFIYKTTKFTYLPDPVPQIDDSHVRDIRGELGVPVSNTVYLHFGGLDIRKGTLEIAKAINCLSEEELIGKSFVFAGKVSLALQQAGFYQELKEIQKKANVVLYDEFCSFEFLNNLCYSCDCILIPYKNFNQSSGVIGYAAHFGKPVIGPSEGLLGRLINDYHLGQVVPNMNIQKICQSIMQTEFNAPPSEYALHHSVAKFNKCFLSNE